MQAARDDRARVALDTAVELDPYHKRAAFSRFLLEELDAFTVTESEHFILKHRPGADEVVASGMLGPLEAMHADLVARFQHEPDRKTVIELMPDHEFFAVRITGMPQIHTIAACTGPLIAIEVPKDTNPRKHLGLFDWLRVLRHEYAHTITLSQTRNRIPHWLTEAAATSIEDVPRRYDTCGELAARWRKAKLFDLDEISFAFIRPKKPGDRSMAYAQGAWMVEFMNERWGEQALVDLMALYSDGVREEEAIPQTLGISRKAFHLAFLEWAGEEVAAWGLDPSPSLDELADEVRLADPRQRAALDQAKRERLARIAAGITAEVGAPRSGSGDSEGGASNAEVWPALARPPVELDDATLATLLETHPGHPDLLELVLRRRLRTDSTITPEVEDLLARYAAARPVDPYPHRILARHLLDGDDPVRAIPHLVELDLRSVKDPSFALEIARLGRVAGDREIAFQASERAARMNPYDPATRELAAACAIEAGRLDDARRHIHSLTILEPDEPRHLKRLQAVERLMGGSESGKQKMGDGS
jgi:tetratricopeptide (TPR) repeat protein